MMSFRIDGTKCLENIKLFGSLNQMLWRQIMADILKPKKEHTAIKFILTFCLGCTRR